MTQKTSPTSIQYQRYHELYAQPLQEPFIPSEAQKEREAQLKQFNRLYVLVPIILISVISVIIILLLVGIVLTMAISGNKNPEFYSFISGLADTIIITFAIPMILLMISGPMMLGAMINNSWKRRKEGRPAFDQGGRLQILLWQLENGLKNTQEKTNEVSPKMADQVIRLNESIAYVEGFSKQIASYFKRS